YLETVLDWISEGEIEEYMATHQNDADANVLWVYYQNVVNWFKTVFPNYRKEMKGLPLGFLYNDHKANVYNSTQLEAKITEMLVDEDVTKKPGIFLYLITNKPKFLNIRVFSNSQKREVYQKQEGKCVKCTNTFNIEEMEADHITPWVNGGKTHVDNCQMLCKGCNRTKSDS
ncbi:HNH endonuclease, partial [Romboutsia sp.]|uniref:HNH endonuclease n=1 Tax=Romboutsia sp. TaxID=1965302 RepID=UPI003F3D9C75